MAILKFLQQNAEWMCAIAIVIFSAVQCWLVHQQTLQNLRIKRLELANQLDEVASIFIGEKEDAEKVRSWLSSNMSNFAFLLNSRDVSKFKNLCLFIYKYNDCPPVSDNDKRNAAFQFTQLVCELSSVLGNADYGLNKKCKKDTKVGKKIWWEN